MKSWSERKRTHERRGALRAPARRDLLDAPDGCDSLAFGVGSGAPTEPPRGCVAGRRRSSYRAFRALSVMSARGGAPPAPPRVGGCAARTRDWAESRADAAQIPVRGHCTNGWTCQRQEPAHPAGPGLRLRISALPHRTAARACGVDTDERRCSACRSDPPRTPWFQARRQLGLGGQLPNCEEPRRTQRW